ncbi:MULTISPECIES: sensor domain-containing diguanylate cyclase [Pseudomonas]|uniref:sensor domain-containing diguanylate cyclase n=1 Tax=Pseudomonas TaxID=286 RepID=UPI000876CB42|nr:MULTISPECIES: sensor domain-containing diguanylate cyclase [Pseudomonas]MBP3997956.1 diguanylate cyclase [Pseudomonas koreensis]POA37706.1 HAMP domain-containing protein [Pseudomonas sp. GW456-12-1-14-TSB6]QIA04151.1 diguanylate cyclase [Pseudomonas fluorescens]TFA84818.1 diguanylate cyclase (GGDEF)-like protein [Pseudomonas sp. LAIL14HWK12:I2]SCZ30757.1 diguanylate cyclase (GGDEF) domain-containing protein [Pseudomonas sp. NFIX46]
MLKASLRSHLTLWFAGLSLLTLLSVGFYVGHIATEQMKQASGNALLSTARSAAALLGEQLRERQLEVYLLSRAPHLERGDLDNPAILKSMQLRTQARAEYAWMGIADANGQVHQAVNGLLVGQSVQQRPWFQAGLRGEYTGDPHEAVLLAKMLPALANGEPLRFIDFAAPIHNADGQVIGVLGAHAHWSWVTRIVESAALSHKGVAPDIEALIVDHDGKVLYPEALVGQQLAANNPDSPGWTVGDGYLTSAVTVPTPLSTALSWSIAVRQPLDTALQPARLLLYKLLLLGVMAAVVFALVAYYLALYLSRPIEQLARSAQQVQNNQPGTRFQLQHPVREIAQLGQSIDTMTQSLLAKERELQEANASLEATVAQRTAALTQANAELLSLATHDGLTGAFNRRRLDEKLTEYSLLFRRTGRPFALLLIDVDHFKRINDTHGHAVGDDVLRQLAQLIQISTRATDFVARYGGEEFAVLLPEIAKPDTPEVVAEKIRTTIAEATFPLVGLVTVSIGVGLADPADNTPTALVKRADQRLYKAKAAGRNQVACQASLIEVSENG